jgi:drug/metabolite transporter (DMT)-like permease
MPSFLIFLLALVPPFFFGLTNLVDYKLINAPGTNHVPTMTFLSCLTNILFISILLFFAPISMPDPGLVPLLLLIGGLEVAYIFPYFHSYKYLDTSIISALWALARVLTPLLAFVIAGEKSRAIQYLAFFIIIAASILLSLEKGKKTKLNRGFGLMLFGGILVVILNVFYKSAEYKMDWINLLFWTSVASSLWSGTLLLSRKTRKNVLFTVKNIKHYAPWFLVNEFFQTSGRAAQIFLLSLAPVIYLETGLCFQPFLVLGITGIACKLWKNFPVGENRTSLTRKLVCFAIMLSAAFLLI